MEKETGIRCSICKKVKSKEAFYESSLKKQDYRCKPCKLAQGKNNIRNIRCLINIYYLRQVNNKRGLPVTHTSKELQKWALNNKEFMDLHRIWVKNDYKDELKPSIIRIQSKKGFTFDNLVAIAKYQIRDKRSDPRAKMINQYTLDRVYVATYPNAKIASEILGYKTYSGISSTCRGERKSAYGYFWAFT